MGIVFYSNKKNVGKEILLYIKIVGNNRTILKAIVQFWWIGMDFHQSFKKCSIFTPDIRKQPHISLESV